MQTATQARDSALERVKENNLRDHKRILSFAYGWIKGRMKPFTSEDLKDALDKAGQPPPNEPRVYGSVFTQLSKERLIFTEGNFKTSNNPLCHRRPQRIWISRFYALKQQQNATINSRTQVKLF